MDIPKFTDEHIAPERKKSRAGESFQEFIADLLAREYGDLTLFKTSGKDGAIDHVIHFADGRGVVECKDIQGEYDSTLKAWQAVADKLRRNITPADGPPKGQGQYRPWYNTKAPINSYLFCASSEIGNEGQHQKLEKEIQSFFTEVSSTHPHLSHLSVIKVEALPWNRLHVRILQHADIAFKWFPSCRPTGLIPLKSTKDARLNFRSYLGHHQLLFFSAEMFVSDGPSHGAELPAVSQLFGQLAGEGCTGLIITGKGGIGKTRLVLEVGRHAETEGWLVLQAGKRFEADSIDSLCKKTVATKPILILFDYVESQKGFAESIDIINDYNEEHGYRIRYVANCRTNFYGNLRDMEDHKEVNLSPGGRNAELFTTYRLAIVRHILEHCGVAAPEEYIAVCRDLPILAVFISFLRQKGREAELRELRAEDSFILWLNRRLTASLSGLYPNNATGMNQDLHRLLAQYPLSEKGLELLGEQEPQLYSLHVGLANDGWVLVDDNDLWVSAHDIFVDQILGDFFRHSQRPQSEIRRTLDLAARLLNIKSALFSYQRIAEELESLPWQELIAEQINRNGEEWLDVRNALLTTPLLHPEQQLELLEGHNDFWAGVECQVGIQNALGYLARLQAKGKLQLPPHLFAALVGWLTKAASCPGSSNFFLNWALRLSPGTFQWVVHDWIQARPRQFQSHYLMVAWLEAKLPALDIAAAVKTWCSVFADDLHLTFLAKAWLDHGGPLQEIREEILAWLAIADNSTAPDAQYVYKSWLDAGGGIDDVKASILKWLATGDNITAPAAQYVYKSWLDAGGGIDDVKSFILKWLEIGDNSTASAAGYVYKSWLDAGGGIDDVKSSILKWLATGDNSTASAAGYVYKSWLDAGGGIDDVKSFILKWLATGDNSTASVAGFVYKGWFDAGGEIDDVKVFILNWFVTDDNSTALDAQFVYRSWLDAGGGIDDVKSFILKWLATVDNSTASVAQFVYKGWLDAGGGIDDVKSFILKWLATTDNSTVLDAQFVYKGWLDAGGGIDDVKFFILKWLQTGNNNVSAEADYLCCSWLKAGGELDFIRTFIQNWLQHPGNAERKDVDFLIASWLKAHGDFPLVQETACKWLAENKEKFEASYIARQIARIQSLPLATIRDILIWCRTYCGNDYAISCMARLNQNLQNNTVLKDAIETLMSLLPHVLLRATINDFLQKNVINIFINLLYNPALKRGRDKDALVILFAQWARDPRAFAQLRAQPNNKFEQNRVIFQLLVDAFTKSLLDEKKDEEGVRNFLAWVNSWEPDRKETIKLSLGFLIKSQHLKRLGAGVIF